VPEGLAVLGVFKGVQVFVFHFGFPPFLIREKGIKNTHPLNKDQGWDTVTCSIPRFHPGCLFSEATHWHCNGRTRRGISSPQLRSGIVPGSVTEALHQNGILSGNLSGTACLHHSFFVQKM